MVIPPISCDRAVCGLMIRPTANTPSSRGTRTSPVSASTRDLGELGAEGVRRVAARLRLGVVAGGARARRRAVAADSSRQRPGGLDDRRAPGGGAHRAAGDATPAGSVAVADLDLDALERARPSASAAICGQRGPRAGADVGGADPDACSVPSGSARTRARSRRRAAPGRSRRRRRSRPASAPRGAAAARRAPPSRTARAPSRRQSTRWRLRERLAGLGVDLGLVADAQLDRVDAERLGELVDRATRARTCPGHSPGARIHDGVGTSSAASRCVVRRFGAAYIIRVATAVCSANSSIVRRSARRRRGAIAGQPPVAVGAEPEALDRRRAVAGEREHLLAGQCELHRAADRPARPSRRASRAGGRRPSSRSRRPRSGEMHADPLRRQAEHLGDLARVEPWVASWTRRRRPARDAGVRLHRVVVLVGRRVRAVQRAARRARVKERTRRGR